VTFPLLRFSVSPTLSCVCEFLVLTGALVALAAVLAAVLTLARHHLLFPL